MNEYLQNIPHDFIKCNRNCKNNFINIVFSYRIHNLISVSYNRHTTHILTVTARIIVHNTFYLQIQISTGFNFLKDSICSCTCTHQQYISPILFTGNICSLLIYDSQNSITKTYSTGHAEKQKPIKYIITSGHPFTK